MKLDYQNDEPTPQHRKSPISHYMGNNIHTSDKGNNKFIYNRTIPFTNKQEAKRLLIDTKRYKNHDVTFLCKNEKQKQELLEVARELDLKHVEKQGWGSVLTSTLQGITHFFSNFIPSLPGASATLIKQEKNPKVNKPSVDERIKLYEKILDCFPLDKHSYTQCLNGDEPWVLRRETIKNLRRLAKTSPEDFKLIEEIVSIGHMQFRIFSSNNDPELPPHAKHKAHYFWDEKRHYIGIIGNNDKNTLQEIFQNITKDIELLKKFSKKTITAWGTKTQRNAQSVYLSIHKIFLDLAQIDRKIANTCIDIADEISFDFEEEEKLQKSAHFAFKKDNTGSILVITQKVTIEDLKRECNLATQVGRVNSKEEGTRKLRELRQIEQGIILDNPLKKQQVVTNYVKKTHPHPQQPNDQMGYVEINNNVNNFGILSSQHYRKEKYTHRYDKPEKPMKQKDQPKDTKRKEQGRGWW